jgi:uncharacterized protein
MKIICLEEHTHDAAVAKATLHAAAKQAPYMADLGSQYQEEPSSDRPGLQAPKRAVELASAPVENRLSAMHADGIDMQVLSDSDSMQSAPLDSAVELARAVNDRPADAVAKHPDRFAGFSTLPLAGSGRRCSRVGADRLGPGADCDDAAGASGRERLPR